MQITISNCHVCLAVAKLIVWCTWAAYCLVWQQNNEVPLLIRTASRSKHVEISPEYCLFTAVWITFFWQVRGKAALSFGIATWRNSENHATAHVSRRTAFLKYDESLSLANFPNFRKLGTTTHFAVLVYEPEGAVNGTSLCWSNEPEGAVNGKRK